MLRCTLPCACSQDAAFYEKDCLLFVIDARPRMMQPTTPGGVPPLVQALGAVAASMRGRVVAGDTDDVGVLLYGTKNQAAPEELAPFANTWVADRQRAPQASPTRGAYPTLTPSAGLCCSLSTSRRPPPSRSCRRYTRLATFPSLATWTRT